MNGDILYTEDVIRTGVLGICGVGDTCDTRLNEQRGGAGDIANQPQSGAALDEQRVCVWQENEAVRMRQSACQDIDADVMLLG